MTGRNLCQGALRLIGAIATGETMTASAIVDALSALNQMLETWSIEGLMVYQVTRETFTLTAGQQQRTMGATGNFVTTRPSKITNMGVIKDSTEFPIKMRTVDEWARISLKSLQSTLPTDVYVEGTTPLETLNFYPIPSEANSVAIYSLKPFTAITDNASVTLPPGYLRALRYNLAVELAPEYGKAVTAEVASRADDSKAAIMRLNTKPVFMESDAIGLFKSDGFTKILLGDR